MIVIPNVYNKLIRVNLFYIVGFLININYITEPLGISVQGYSFIYPILLIIAIIANDFKLNSSLHNYIILIFFLITYYFISFFLSDLAEYSVYKTVMFFLKIVPFLLLPLFIKDSVYSFFKGYFISLLVAFFLILFYSIKYLPHVSLNNRLEIGNLNPIWIGRLVIELYLIVLLIFNKVPRSIKIFLFFSGLIVLYVCGSKGPIVAGLLIFIIYIGKRISSALKVFFLLIFVIIGVISFRYINMIPQKTILFRGFLE